MGSAAEDHGAVYTRLYLERNKAFFEWRDACDIKIEIEIHKGRPFDEAQFLGTLFARRDYAELFERMTRLDEDLHLHDRGLWEKNARAQRDAMETIAGVEG